MVKSFTKLIASVCLFIIISLNSGWAQNIAVLIPQGWILAGDDPANDDPPGAKEFTFESIELEHSFGFFRLISHMEENGLNVKLYGSDNDDPAEVISSNDIIYIPEYIGSTSIATDYNDSSIPIIISETFLLDDMGFAPSSDGFSNDLNANTLKVVNSNHPITQGLPTEFPIGIIDPATNEPSYLVLNSFKTAASVAALANVGELLITASGFDTRDPAGALVDSPAVIAVETGTPLIGGGTNAARWVFLPFSDKVMLDSPINTATEAISYELMSDFGFQLIDQAIAWALGQTTKVQDWEIH